MSTNTDVLRPLKRITATVRGRAISFTKPKPTSVTQNFFARGEEQEATGYENLAPDDPILEPPALEFDSFDKIPRRRGSLFGAGVSVLVVAAVGFVTWRSFHSLSKPGSSVAAASRAMVQTPPSPVEPVAQPVATRPEPVSQSMTVEPTAPATQSTSTAPAEPVAKASTASAEPVAKSTATAQKEPVAKSTAAPEREPVAKSTATARQEPVAKSTSATEQDAPGAKPVPVIVPLISKPAPGTKHTPAAHERAKNDTSDEPVEVRKHSPLRGYVWSPDKHTLVPADPVVEDLPPAESPRSQSLDGTPAEQPQPPTAPTTPAPFEPPSSASSATPTPAPAPSPNEAPVIE